MEIEGIDTLLDEARDLLGDASGLRREIHRWPEQGNDNPTTRDQILEAIEPLGLDVKRHETTSGIAALLTGGEPGPTVLLRADTDALPMPEDTGLDFSSKVDNTMHACGHDTHVAMLVGAARLLAARRDKLRGRVLFMFQPGEEGHHGARFMLDEGLLDVPVLAGGAPSPVSAAYAIHTTSALNTGFISTRPGPLMASADEIHILVKGRGGHASEPFRALDPIPIACEIVQAMQTMITRRIDVFDPAVVTVGRITAGTTNNVIPETAEIEGTIRAVSERTRSSVHDGIKRVAEGIAAAHDAEVSIEIVHGYPVTINGNDAADTALGVASALLGERNTIRLPHPIMGAEDFSYVLQRVPGAMIFLGGTHPDRNPATAAPNHSNRVMFDEEAMVTGMALHTALALHHLSG
jgi:hippurate hydrolase